MKLLLHSFCIFILLCLKLHLQISIILIIPLKPLGRNILSLYDSAGNFIEIYLKTAPDNNAIKCLKLLLTILHNIITDWQYNKTFNSTSNFLKFTYIILVESRLTEKYIFYYNFYYFIIVINIWLIIFFLLLSSFTFPLCIICRGKYYLSQNFFNFSYEISVFGPPELKENGFSFALRVFVCARARVWVRVCM